MEEKLNIEAFIKDNPLLKLSSDYGSKIVQKIKSEFTTEEEKMFIFNFYCYVNYKPNDFVILLNDIWKWLGYTRIDHCKTVLLKHFKENIDYKIENFFPATSGIKTEVSQETEKIETRGRKQEYITLTVNCFKKLCLKSRTDQADKIHDYYVNLEKIINETVIEEADELRKMLESQQTQLKLKDSQKHNIFITNFKDRHIIYLIQVENNLIKFGYTKDLEQRYKDHYKEFGNDIEIKFVYETIYNREFEEMIKNQFQKHIITKKFKTVQKELIQLTEDFTFENLIKDIEKLKKVVNENLVPKLIKEITDLKIHIAKLEQENSLKPISEDKILIERLKDENQQLKWTVLELQNKLSNYNHDLEKEKLEIKRQEIDLRYNQPFKRKNTVASEHKTVNGVEFKLCMGISCTEELEEGKWLTLDCFGKSGQNKDGYRSSCKKCRSIAEKVYYKNQENTKMTEEELNKSKENRSIKLRKPLIDNKKECSFCKKLKDIQLFGKAGEYKTGESKYRSRCRECENELKRLKAAEKAKEKRENSILQLDSDSEKL